MTAAFDDSFNGVGPGSSFFKPADHTGTHALLIEPFSYDAAAPNPFFKRDEPEGFGNYATRKEAAAKLTIFGTPDKLKAGEGVVIPHVVFSQPILAEDLGQRLNKVVVFTVEKGQGKNGRQGSWKFKAVPQHVAEGVKAYYLAREAEAAAPTVSDDEAEFLKTLEG